jgi:ribosome maturation factor RimP
MTRPLKTQRDFERVLEKNIHLSYVDASEPDPLKAPLREIRGRLLAVSDREVRIVPRDNKGREGVELAVPLSALRHAQREISFR